MPGSSRHRCWAARMAGRVRSGWTSGSCRCSVRSCRHACRSASRRGLMVSSSTTSTATATGQGFPLTAADQLNYDTYLANLAHSDGLSVALKNDLGQAAALKPYFDYAINEQCMQYKECDYPAPGLPGWTALGEGGVRGRVQELVVQLHEVERLELQRDPERPWTCSIRRGRPAGDESGGRLSGRGARRHRKPARDEGVALRSRMRRFPLAAKRVTILFDIDGTLINSGGAGAASWRLAFDELYGIPADIGEFTDAGMADPDVGRKDVRGGDAPSAGAGRVRPAAGTAPARHAKRRSRTRPPTESCRAWRRCCPGCSTAATCWGS